MRADPKKSTAPAFTEPATSKMSASSLSCLGRGSFKVRSVGSNIWPFSEMNSEGLTITISSQSAMNLDETYSG